MIGWQAERGGILEQLVLGFFTWRTEITMRGDEEKASNIIL